MDWKNTWNQIVDAAKQAAGAAVDSGKTVLETHRINKDIIEGKLALAELYLERYTAGLEVDEETAALCDDILDNMAKTEAMAYAAQDARAAAKTAAGAAVDGIKAGFASAADTVCGADCIDEDETDVLCCPDCGYPMLDNYHYCPGCGVKLETVDELVDVAAEVEAPAAETGESPAEEAPAQDAPEATDTPAE